MNDFTKDELMLLNRWSSSRREDVGPIKSEEEGTIHLENKIKYMIAKNFIDKNQEILKNLAER
jgi:hypothetical protein